MPLEKIFGVNFQQARKFVIEIAGVPKTGKSVFEG